LAIFPFFSLLDFFRLFRCQFPGVFAPFRFGPPHQFLRTDLPSLRSIFVLVARYGSLSFISLVCAKFGFPDHTSRTRIPGIVFSYSVSSHPFLRKSPPQVRKVFFSFSGSYRGKTFPCLRKILYTSLPPSLTFPFNRLPALLWQLVFTYAVTVRVLLLGPSPLWGTDLSHVGFFPSFFLLVSV